MKKTFVTAAMMSAAFWFAPQVNAQGGARSIPVSFKTPADPSSAAAPEVSELAKKAQVEKYSGATDLIWESQGNSQSVCSFSLNNIRYRAAYNKNGHLRWTEKSYNGNVLDQEVRNKIFRFYGEVTIGWVHEVEVPQSSTNYFVMVHDAKHSWRIRIVDETIDTLEEFSKE